MAPMRVSSSDRAVPASKSGSSQSDGWSRQRGVDENADQASSSSSSTPAGSGSPSPRMAGTSPVPGSVQCGRSTPRPGVISVGESGGGWAPVRASVSKSSSTTGAGTSGSSSTAASEPQSPAGSHGSSSGDGSG